MELAKAIMEKVVQISPVVTVIISFFAMRFAYKASRQTIYVNTIVVEKIKKLSQLKESVSEYLLELRQLRVEEEYGDEMYFPERVLYLKQSIIFQLSPIIAREAILIDSLKDLALAKYLNETRAKYGELNQEQAYKFTAMIDALERDFHQMFQIEWEEIQKEAKGKKMTHEEAEKIRNKFGSKEILEEKNKILKNKLAKAKAKQIVSNMKEK